MGNHMCCAQPSRTTAAAKVIRWNDGGIEEFREAIKVGEVMVDNPQQIVCAFTNLQAGRRIEALGAEEDLEMGGVYILLPMQKYLRCVLSPSDMTSLNLLALQCNSGRRKPSCNSVIFPAVGTDNLPDFSSLSSSADRSVKLQAQGPDRFVVPKLELIEDEEQPMGLPLGSCEYKIRGFRYWKPVLETIKESPRVCKP